MEPKYEDGRLFFEEEGKTVAEITYVQEGNVFTIDHTFVDPAFRGQGIAAKLVGLAVAEIKRRNGEVRATCWYAKDWLQEHK